MNNAAIIGIKKAQKNISECVSEFEEPEAPKSNLERNDNPVSRFFAITNHGKKLRQAGINAMCAHCMGCTAKEQGEKDWIEPGFREQIRGCSSFGCPLWGLRPYQRGVK